MDPGTVSTAVTTTTSFLADRSDAMVILVIFIAFGAWWMWKVQIPRLESERKLREADKEIHQANAATLAELSKITTGIHQSTSNSNTTLRAMLVVKKIEIDCIDKVSTAAGCDIRDKLAEARGVLRAVEAGATE